MLPPLRSASRATAPRSPARSGSPRRRCARSCSTSRRRSTQQGFRRLVIVNNHFEPEQVATLRAAAADAGALYLDLVRRRNAQRLTDEFRRGSCHAGRYETSLVLADAPQLVDSAAAEPARERGRHARGDGGRAHRLRRDGHGSRVLRRARGGERRGGPRDVRDPDRHARRARRGARHRTFNLASWFVDRHLEEGRGDRTALLCGERRVSYAELAALVNRAGHVLRELGVRQEERVLLALSDGVEFVATWYAAQKIGAVTAEVYTFLPAKDFAYYLDYTRAGVVVVDATHARPRARGARRAGRPAVAARAAGRRASRRRSCSEGEASFDALVARRARPRSTPPPRRPTTSRSGSSRPARPACRRRACTAMQTPLRSFEHYARGVLDIREDDVVLPVPKLFFGYARDLAALYPFGVGAAGIVFAERSTPERMFELIAHHRPTILVNVPTMIRAMLEQPDHDLSCLRLCTSAGEALPRGAAPSLDRELRRRGARRHRLLRGLPHLHLQPAGRRAPGNARPGRAGLQRPGGRRGRAASCPTARPADCGSRATPPRSCTGTRARSPCRPTRATWS